MGSFVWGLAAHAEREAHVLLFEPAGTRNTGNVRNEHTVDEPGRL